MRKACSTQSTYSAGVSSPTMSERLRIRVFLCRQLSATRRLYKPSPCPAGPGPRDCPWTWLERTVAVADKALLGGRFSAERPCPNRTRPAGGKDSGTRSRVRSWLQSTGSGAQPASSATSRRSPGLPTRSPTRRSGATRTRDVYRATLDYFIRELLRELGLRRLRGSRRHARRAEPAARRAGLRHRLALRLEPERRQVRRDDGRRHGARGLPAERRARARPAAAADLLPRGGGLGLRADAAREPDHAPARHRGGAPRDVPRRRRRPQLLGARRPTPATSPSAGASRSTCSTT